MSGQPLASEETNLEALLLATAGGDRQAFARLYQETAGQLLAVALKVTRRRDLAEDVLQDAYCAIWQKAGQFREDRGRAMAWLVMIVRYRAIDRLRSQQRRAEDQGAEELSELDLPDALVASPVGSEAALDVRRCLNHLQPNPRRAILLSFYYGLTHEEVSAQMDVPLGTVKSWVRRGLLQLKDCLDR